MLGAQLYDIVQYENHLQHLTNWAWVLHGLAALVCAVLKKPPALYILVPAGVAYFVAAGIASIQVMDDKMLKDFEKEHGATLVHFANFVFHYLPPLFWFGIILWDRNLIREWAWCALKNGQVFLQTFFSRCSLCWRILFFFTLSEQYPGGELIFTSSLEPLRQPWRWSRVLSFSPCSTRRSVPTPMRAQQHATSFFTCGDK